MPKIQLLNDFKSRFIIIDEVTLVELELFLKFTYQQIIIVNDKFNSESQSVASMIRTWTTEQSVSAAAMLTSGYRLE